MATQELETMVSRTVEQALEGVVGARQAFTEADILEYRESIAGMLAAADEKAVDKDATASRLSAIIHRLGLTSKQVRDDLTTAVEIDRRKDALAKCEKPSAEARAALEELQGVRLKVQSRLKEIDEQIVAAEASLKEVAGVEFEVEELKASAPRLYSNDIPALIGELH